MNKDDYIRLQQLSSEINDIMYKNNLNELRITAEKRSYDKNTNNVSIVTKKYIGDAVEYKSSNKIWSSDDSNRSGFEFQWNYDEFMNQ